MWQVTEKEKKNRTGRKKSENKFMFARKPEGVGEEEGEGKEEENGLEEY